jgi:hypothetical protein
MASGVINDYILADVESRQLAHAAVPGGDYLAMPAPRTAQGALLHYDPILADVESCPLREF